MKEEMLKQIVEEVKCGTKGSSEGYNSYDTWGNPERSNIFQHLKFHMIDENVNGFKYNGEMFIVEFRHNNGITGMGGTPDSISVRTLNLFEEDNENVIKIDSYGFTEWCKKHYKYVDEGIMSLLLEMVDFSNADIKISKEDWAKMKFFNGDVSKWDTKKKP